MSELRSPAKMHDGLTRRCRQPPPAFKSPQGQSVPANHRMEPTDADAVPSARSFGTAAHPHVRHQVRGTGHGNGGKGIWRHSVALSPLPSSETGEPSREMDAAKRYVRGMVRQFGWEIKTE